MNSVNLAMLSLEVSTSNLVAIVKRSSRRRHASHIPLDIPVEHLSRCTPTILGIEMVAAAADSCVNFATSS